MSRLLRVISGLFLFYACQFLITTIISQESGIFIYFMIQTGFAFSPDAESGQNVSPEGATMIKQLKDSRWVIYDRGDKTDWLKVSPPNETDKQLLIRFNFLRVDGKAIIEVYTAEPHADFLEKRTIERAGSYEYVTETLKTHYVKVYAADQGNLAHYEFSYTLIPLPDTPSSSTPTFVLRESDFQAIGDRYGISPSLLQVSKVIRSQREDTTGKYEVCKVVDQEELKFLQKIALHTNRALSDFKGSPTGAMGYMQLMPSTFYLYAQDGNGDGIKDPLNPYDSIATAAYFLAREIAKENSIERALRNYINDRGREKK